MRDAITSLKEVFHVRDITSERMKEAIKDWYRLYFGVEDSADEDDTQRIAYTIVRKITKNVFAEYDAQGKTEFEKQVLEALDRAKKKAMQGALIGGEVLLKPLIFGKRLEYLPISRPSMVIVGRNESNQIVDLCTEERSEEDGHYYTLCERRYLNGDGRLTILTKLFRSDDLQYYGKEVQLSELERYRDVEPILTLPIDNIGLVSLSCPAENCVDGSDDAVSIYAAAAKLIHEINVNEAQLSGEFERGMSRLIVSNDFLRKDDRGRKAIVDDIFTGLNDDPENVGIQIFSPVLREEAYNNRKREYLRNIESIIGLKRGLLSDVESEDKTATEITSSAGDYNLTVIDFQEAWEATVKEALEITGRLTEIYKRGNATWNEDNIAISWGNGVLYDENKTWADYQTMVATGQLKPEIPVAWYFGKDYNDPKVLEEVREKYMPPLMTLLNQPAE